VASPWWVAVGGCRLGVVMGKSSHLARSGLASCDLFVRFILFFFFLLKKSMNRIQ
jgi:hypothetical protein